MTAMVPFLNQHHTRIRSDGNSADGGTPTWETTENQATTLTYATETAVRIRFGVENTGDATATSAKRLYCSKNGGTYFQVNDTSSSVHLIDASSGNDAYTIATSNFLLTAGTGTAATGEYRDNLNFSISANLAAGNYTEYEFGFEIVDADVAHNDTLDFRVYYNDAAMDNYDHTPRITVNKSSNKTITAEGGTYSMSGTAANLEFGRIVTASGGTYAMSGTAASLIRGKVIAADGGTYAMSGTDASFVRTYIVGADGGTYSLAGTDANLEFGRVVLGLGGTYAMSGTDANLEWGRTVAASGGAYAMSGTDAGLLRALLLSAAGGSYSISGTDAGLNKGRSITASGGSYAMSGTDAGLIHAYVIAASGGSYAMSGTDATLTKARVFTVEGGSYSMTGTDANLTTSGGASTNPIAASMTRRRRY